MSVHIAYVCDRLEPISGWAVLNYHTIRQARDAGCKVSVFHTKGVVPAYISGVDYYPILTSKTLKWFKFALVLFDIAKLRFILSKKTESFDYVHILVEPYIPIALGFPRKPKKILSIVGTYSILCFRGDSEITNYLNKFCLRIFDRGVSISDYSKKNFLSQSLCLSNIVVCGEGVEDKDRIDVVDKEFYFVLVAPQLKARKGVLYALKAFQMCLRHHPDLKLHIVCTLSSSRYSVECEDFVFKNGLTESVIWRGRLSDQELKATYARAIGNLLPSVNEGIHFEGYGNVHIEANAAGTVTIGSRNCGNETSIIDGETGFLCNQADSFDIHLKMLMVINIFKNNEMKKYSSRCIRHAADNTWEKYFQRLQRDCYQF